MSNSQLDKLKPRMIDGTEVTLKLSSNAVGDSNNENKFPHKLLLTSQQAFLVFQHVFQTSLKRLQDVLARRLAITSWRSLGRQKSVPLKTSWGCLQDVFSTSSPRRMFVG